MAPKGLQAFARIWGIHAQSTMPDYAERHDNIALIEDKVKNKFKWSWLEEKDHLGDYFSVYVRKLKVAGLAECIWCNDHLKYASRGKQCLRDHAKTSKHKTARNSVRSTQQLPAMFLATKKAINS